MEGVDAVKSELRESGRQRSGQADGVTPDRSHLFHHRVSDIHPQPPNPDEAVLLHFVCFVHRDGRLYELDGRKAGALDHGPTSPETLLEVSGGRGST